MYQHFYGLHELPFELTPNPRYLFLTRQHREALTTLEYGLFSAKGVTALIGEAGTGKTTLIHAALESERCRNVTCVYLNNPTLTRQEFIETLALRFGLSVRAGESKAALIEELERVLRERRARGQITALVLDEAQSFSDELLEEIRLLANTETSTEKLLPLVLAGQPELGDRLNESSLRQLKQRVTLRCEIEPFSQQETAAYISHRIRMAGGEAASLFTREAVMLIHERSGGIARTITVICDNALLTGLGLGRQPVDSAVVLEVARDFDLRATANAVNMSAQTVQAVPAYTFHDPTDARPAFMPEGGPEEADVQEATLREFTLRKPEPGGAAPSGAAPATAASPNGLPGPSPEDARELFTGPRRPRRFSLFSVR